MCAFTQARLHADISVVTQGVHTCSQARLHAWKHTCMRAYIHCLHACTKKCTCSLNKMKAVVSVMRTGICNRKTDQQISLSPAAPLNPWKLNVDCVQSTCADRAKKRLEVAMAPLETCFNIGRLGVRGPADISAYNERSSFFWLTPELNSNARWNYINVSESQNVYAMYIDMWMGMGMGILYV